jgi:hypothetical protein
MNPMSDPELPLELEVFFLSVSEAAEMNHNLFEELSKRGNFRLGHINNPVVQAALEKSKPETINGGWYYWYRMRGCPPENYTVGPFDTRDTALAAAREDWPENWRRS